MTERKWVWILPDVRLFLLFSILSVVLCPKSGPSWRCNTTDFSLKYAYLCSLRQRKLNMHKLSNPRPSELHGVKHINSLQGQPKLPNFPFVSNMIAAIAKITQEMFHDMDIQFRQMVFCCITSMELIGSGTLAVDHSRSDRWFLKPLRCWPETENLTHRKKMYK